MSDDPGRDSDELYVGYLPQTPLGIARFVRRTVWLLAVVIAGVAVLLALLQSRFDPGLFEFGSPRTLVGRIVERPYPALILNEQGVSGDGSEGRHTRLLLVAPGKRGAQDRVKGLAGVRVETTGTLSSRSDLAVFELAADPDQLPAPVEPSPIADTPGQRVTLRGEIVDSKCFSGVMKPGRDKVHRSCAARCIAGGIPPAFVASAEGGGVDVYVLADEVGAPLSAEILPWVGEPIEIEGVVEPWGDLTLLRADPAGFRRLSSESPAG